MSLYPDTAWHAHSAAEVRCQIESDSMHGLTTPKTQKSLACKRLKPLHTMITGAAKITP